MCDCKLVAVERIHKNRKTFYLINPLYAEHSSTPWVYIDANCPSQPTGKIGIKDMGILTTRVYSFVVLSRCNAQCDLGSLEIARGGTREWDLGRGFPKDMEEGVKNGRLRGVGVVPLKE